MRSRAMCLSVQTDEGSSFDASAEAKRAANEAMFRGANERIREVVDRRDVVMPVVPFVCECSDPACRRLIDVPLRVYKDVRRSPRRFIHASDHVDDGTSGTVIEARDGYAVVEKSGVAARVAEQDLAKGE
jgi:hypothetical protein